jgi:P pilus assembly chaperone PapD
VHNVIVGNSSKNPAYVKVETVAVQEPEKSEKVVPTSELLASPKTFSIEPNGQRTVRLLLKSPPTDKERVFRVSFIPQDRGFGEEVVQNQDGVKTVIKVLTGMGILIFADPLKPVENLSWERVGNKIIFTNTGNVNMYLGDGQSCSQAGVCSKLPSKRLYATNQFEVISPLENTVSIMSKAGGSGGYRKISIPAGVVGAQSLASQDSMK